jgi:glycosyltransferase involved in cell wall biosynthesis
MGKWSHEIADALRVMGHEATMWFVDDFPVTSGLGYAADVVLLKPILLTRRLVQFAKQFDVMVVHEPSGIWYSLLRQFRSELPPMVAMCHNVESKSFSDLAWAAEKGYGSVTVGRRIRTKFLRHWQSDGAIRMADAVVCLSSLDRQYIISKLGRRSEDVFVMVNGVTREHFVGSAEGRTGHRVLVVGGWLQVKGSDLLPEIWRRVCDRWPDATLSLVGTHAPAAAVTSAFDPDLRSSITVRPKVESHQMAEVFDRHDVFLMPSLSEGSPLSLLEAMAAAMPVVAAKVGGIADIVTDDVNGLLFRVIDADDAARCINSIFEDRALALRLARAARDRAAECTWLRAAGTLQRAIERAMALRATPASSQPSALTRAEHSQ